MDDPRPASIHSLARHGLGPAQPVKARPAAHQPRHAPGRCLPRHLVGLPGPDDRQCRDLARGPFGRRPASVARRASADWKWRWTPSARNSTRTGWGICASRAKILSSRLGPARDLDVFSPSFWTRQPKTGDREAFASLRARAGGDARQGLEAGRRLRRRAPISPCSPMTSRRSPIRACRWRGTRKLTARRQAAAGPPAGACDQARPQGAQRRGRRSAPSAHRAQEAALHGGILAPLYPKKKRPALCPQTARLAGTSGRDQRCRPCPRHHGELAARNRRQAVDAGRALCRRAW